MSKMVLYILRIHEIKCSSFSYHFAAVVVELLVEIYLHFRFRFSGPTLKMQVSVSQLGYSRWHSGIDPDQVVMRHNHSCPSANICFPFSVTFFNIIFVFHLNH